MPDTKPQRHPVFIKASLLLIVAVLLLTACVSAPTPAPSQSIPSPVVVLPTVKPSETLDPPIPTALPTALPTPTPSFPIYSESPHPLQIEEMRKKVYEGSEITIEETLPEKDTYRRYIASYLSDGYKVYAFFTIPKGLKPETGWPVIIFNKGYNPPGEYRTNDWYVDFIASRGYIVIKSDYRGVGLSEGGPIQGGAYGSPAYTEDVLAALAAIKKYPDADPNCIGMWGHSMGGQITLRAMVVARNDIKAASIWSGVVAPYPDPFAQRPQLLTPNAPGGAQSQGGYRGWVSTMMNAYGNPVLNPNFWASVSPNSYLNDLGGPIQLHHSELEKTVPIAASEILYSQLLEAGCTECEFFRYPGDDHLLAGSYVLAVRRTMDFLDKHVKHYRD